MKFVLGLVSGALLSYVFINTGSTLPAVFEIPATLQALPDQILASSVVDDPNAAPEARSRAAYLLVKHDWDLFRELDERAGITRELIDGRSRNELLRLRSEADAMDRLAKYPALHAALLERHGVETQEDLKTAMVVERIRAEPLVHAYLRSRYPDETDEGIAHGLCGSDD